MATIYIKEGTKLPERVAKDFYPTPYPFALEALKLLKDINYTGKPEYVVDPGAGTGVWGDAFREVFDSRSHLTGFEVRKKEIGSLNYNEWYNEDYLTSNKSLGIYDLVIGNPPYSHAEEFIRKGLKSLAVGGHLVFLLKLGFLQAGKRMQLWEDYPIKEVVVCANRPSFTGDGKTGGEAFAFYYWEKGYSGQTKLSWTYVK